MGPPLYMWSVINRNVVMQRIPILRALHFLPSLAYSKAGQSTHIFLPLMINGSSHPAMKAWVPEDRGACGCKHCCWPNWHPFNVAKFNR